MTPAREYDGGCHCGAIRFRVCVERHEALECNCSICVQKGLLHLIVTPDRFTLLSGAGTLSTYRFNTGIARHTFCKVCGVQPFYSPRSHPDHIDVNLRCLEGRALDNFRVTSFDGVNWEQSIRTIR